MRFWDSSAIIPLLVPERETSLVVPLHRKNPDMVVWAFTVTEIHSALNRKIRDGTLTEEEMAASKRRLHSLQGNWTEIIHLESTRTKAHRLLGVHPLHAADSLQLAAALLFSEDQPEGMEFVTLDKNLKSAATREGFVVRP